MNSRLLLILLAGSASADITVPGNTPSPSGQAAPAIAVATPGFEIPVTLSAAGMLGTSVSGPYHRVREWVPTDGYMAHFTIDSDFGNFECIGTTQARARINEMEAIGKLMAVSKSDLFADGVKRSIEQPIDAVKNIVKNPVGSVKAVPKTVGHFFRKVGKSVENAASNIKENSENGDNSDVGPGIGRAAKGVIGFDSAKLECARQLGVDPYSDNARLQEEIEKVSWVFFSGGLPLRIGAAVASGGASVALTATKVVGLPEEIYSATPAELTLKNSQAMESMAVPADVSRRFSSNEALSITLRRSIIRSLQAFGDIRGRATIIDLAANCETRRQAELLDQALVMLVQRQQSGRSAFTGLEAVGRLPGAVDAAGLLHIPAPVDHLSWTPEVAEFAHRDDLLGRKPVLLLGGGATDLARAELAKLGWTVTAP